MAIEYDDIIVGAGSSGAVLAARLTEDPWHSVLLLEAGPDYSSVEQTPNDLLNSRNLSVFDHDWHFKAEPMGGREIDFPRGKVTGGSSAVNGAIALRGVPADYDEWASLGNSEWSWQKLLPYFRRIEDDQDEHGDLHGSAGPIPVRRYTYDELAPVQRGFIDACRSLGFADVRDHNDPESTGVGPWPMNRRDYVRISTAIGYLLPARHRLNLTIRANCLVNRVLFDGKWAIGVEVECGGELQRVYGKRITLSAGAVASPAILLRSGIGPWDDLRTLGIEPLLNLPGVGGNLIDHPMVPVLFVPKPGMCDTTQPLAQVGLRYTSPGSDEFNDMQMYAVTFADLTPMPELMAVFGAPLVFGTGPVLQRPRSRGRLSLHSADYHEQARIELNYVADPEDLRRLVEGVRLGWQLAQTPAIQERAERVALLTEEMIGSDEALQGYVKAVASTLYHPVGTARMGPDGDEQAVVDQYCRVRGSENLRVVDASVMPNIPRANTNFTCMVIGERVADWMRDEAAIATGATA